MGIDPKNSTAAMASFMEDNICHSPFVSLRFFVGLSGIINMIFPLDRGRGFPVWLPVKEDTSIGSSVYNSAAREVPHVCLRASSPGQRRNRLRNAPAPAVGRGCRAAT